MVINDKNARRALHDANIIEHERCVSENL
jgi:hypothetical protein